MTEAAIPAATLILVKERSQGDPELLMVTRTRTMAFAPGALVFPGGRIDPADAAMVASLGLEDGAAKVAAIRETIEECAIAVAVEPALNESQSLAMQQALLSGGDLAKLLLDQGLSVQFPALTPYSRWVPEHEVSRRFDTFFFIAQVLEPVVTPSAGSGECESVQWISARDALEQESRGGVKLIYPTRKTLERLAQFQTYEDILADALRHPIVPITARVERHGDGRFVTIPDKLGYPSTRDPLHLVWRG